MSRIRNAMFLSALFLEVLYILLYFLFLIGLYSLADVIFYVVRNMLIIFVLWHVGLALYFSELKERLLNWLNAFSAIVLFFVVLLKFNFTATANILHIVFSFCEILIGLILLGYIFSGKSFFEKNKKIFLIVGLILVFWGMMNSFFVVDWAFPSILHEAIDSSWMDAIVFVIYTLYFLLVLISYFILPSLNSSSSFDLPS